MFKYVSHTADIGVYASSETFEGVLKDLLKGFFSYLFELDSSYKRKLNIKSENIDLNCSELKSLEPLKMNINFKNYEYMIYDLLNELLFKIEYDEIYPVCIKNIELKDSSLILEMASIGREKVHLKNEIKAITHHQLYFKKGDCFEVNVIFDI